MPALVRSEDEKTDLWRSAKGRKGSVQIRLEREVAAN